MRYINIIDLVGVNSYLINTDQGYILIDNGYPAKCKNLEKYLLNAGCNVENLKLVINTHGDHDHAGNGLFLQNAFNTQVAMHKDDIQMVTESNQEFNRKIKADYFPLKFRLMSFMGIFFDSGKFNPYKPDILIDEDFDLLKYGLDAKIVHIPGHSKGSIGVLTKDGDFICGDLIYNFFTPEFLYIDDMEDAINSIEKLKKLKINMVYPGHGKPFLFIDFISKYYDKEFRNKQK